MVHTEEAMVVVGTAVIWPVGVAQMPHDTLFSRRQMPDQQATRDVRTRTTGAAEGNLKLQQFTDAPA